MNTAAVVIERLSPPVPDSDYRDLASLLHDAVQSDAAVSFLMTLTLEEAEEWWRRTVADASRAIFLVARDAQGIAGSVQLHPAWAPNQPHRAEIAKLLVHRRCRRQGLGTRLMLAAEQAARDAGLSLLTLDARRGAEAEQLYRKLGWTMVGVIPDFAVNPDGKGMHDTVIFYKRLG